MIPFISKPKLKDIVNKDIVITDFKGWSEKGKIVPKFVDYEFLFHKFSNCIGGIYLNEKELIFVVKNIFYLKKVNHACGLYHGGKSPYSISNKVSKEYKERKKLLDNLN